MNINGESKTQLMVHCNRTWIISTWKVQKYDRLFSCFIFSFASMTSFLTHRYLFFYSHQYSIEIGQLDWIKIFYAKTFNVLIYYLIYSASIFFIPFRKISLISNLIVERTWAKLHEKHKNLQTKDSHKNKSIQYSISFSMKSLELRQSSYPVRLSVNKRGTFKIFSLLRAVENSSK